MLKNTYTKGDIKEAYNLENYYKKIANYSTITTLPEENVEYIKEALPNVTSCYDMMGYYLLIFGDGCKALTSIDTTGWDTSNITNMNGMFSSCNALTTLDVSNWSTSKVTNMSGMFSDCRELTTLDISNWDTSNVTNMSSMFNSCNALTTLDVSKWDTSKVTNMSYMFFDCSNLKTITGVIDMKSCTLYDLYDGMFTGCTKLTGVKIKNPPAGITATSGIGGLKAGKYTIVS